jgi:hypothetical protein
VLRGPAGLQHAQEPVQRLGGAPGDPPQARGARCAVGFVKHFVPVGHEVKLHARDRSQLRARDSLTDRSPLHACECDVTARHAGAGSAARIFCCAMSSALRDVLRATTNKALDISLCRGPRTG